MFSNDEQLIIWFPRALKFYSFGSSLEDSVVVKQIFDLLNNDERIRENSVDIWEYFKLKAFCKQFEEKAEENKKKRKQKA